MKDTVFQVPGVGIASIREAFNAKVYPTLTDEFVFVELENLEHGTLDLYITNLNGQKVFSLQQEINSPDFSTRIPVSQWAKGVYLMTMSHHGMVGYEKIIVR